MFAIACERMPGCWTSIGICDMKTMKIPILYVVLRHVIIDICNLVARNNLCSTTNTTIHLVNLAQFNIYSLNTYIL